MVSTFLEAWLNKDKKAMLSSLSKLKPDSVDKNPLQSIYEYTQTQNNDSHLPINKTLLDRLNSKVEDINYQVVLLFITSEISYKNKNMNDYSRIDQIFSNLNQDSI